MCRHCHFCRHILHICASVPLVCAHKYNLINMTYIFKMANIFIFPVPTPPVCMVNHRAFIFNTEMHFIRLHTQKELVYYDLYFRIYGHFSICHYNFLIHIFIFLIHADVFT